MPTLAEAQAHQQALEDVTTLAIRDLVELWRTFDPTQPAEVAKEARSAVPELVAAYTLASGTLGADWYDDLREAAGAPGSFAATVVDVLTPDRLQQGIGYALTPIFQREDAADKALSRMAGLSQQLVAEADRAAIAVNAEQDPAGARYTRHASPNACAFCALLATRQAAYYSEETATTSVHGSKYHPYCHCIAVPVWPGQDFEEAPYVADWRESYFNATEKLGGASDPKAILALMRDDLGSH